MIILGIETSCDETAAAIIQGETTDGFVSLISNAISTSLGLHAKTGGIIPEQAAREQIKYIIPIINHSIKNSYLNLGSIDAIAVTVGPGLIGSLLVGVETAKTLAYVLNKPLIPVNHLLGHIYANFIGKASNQKILFPALALIVSGGHTDLVVLKKHGEIQWIGGTRDDAAGEALDKVGRLIDLPYPAGPLIEQRALDGNPKRFPLPRPMMDSKDFDFSFSGLKTAAYRQIKTIEQLSNLPAGRQGRTITGILQKTSGFLVFPAEKKDRFAVRQISLTRYSFCHSLNFS